MLFLFSITSGLFLGWSLGANDAANVFGSAVGSRMLTFKKAATIASIFVIIGAVFQGRGAANTLSDLSEVDALAGAFTVSLCAAFSVYLMTKRGLPVSTGQAVVGAIIGWSFFTGNETNYHVLTTILVSWVTGPILGMVFAALLYLLMRWWLRRLSIHVIKLDTYIRLSLIFVGAFGAYSLGANNIANVMGVFVPSAPDVVLDFGIFSLDGAQLLFLLGGMAIAVGIYTYSERVMNTVGEGILSLTPEAAIVVVLSQALVLFLFSSTSLSNLLTASGLPAIPLVPVSSTQVVVGSVLGIGLIKGAREIKPKVLGGIALGWVATPIVAGLFTWFLLFFVQNVFRLQVTTHTIIPLSPENTAAGTLTPSGHFNLIWPAMLVLMVLVILGLIWYLWHQQRLRMQTENELLTQQNHYFTAQKSLSELEVQTVQLENKILNSRLETKRQELINLALSIEDQRSFLVKINEQVAALQQMTTDRPVLDGMQNLTTAISQRMTFNRDMETFNGQVEQIHKDFQAKLDAVFPGLTDQEKRLATLLRLNLSTKEIAALLNISPKSAETARYRLRKRLNIQQGENLNLFINNL
ncbi:MAG TPA: hypothetical protein DCR43_04865 [Bacteroidales bacterium]|nr:MAG: hypothetical protein A2X09_01390 [Bacteroidetes bacterium GWF2_43_11]PKP27788.1 MAG: hypothetical protein CVU06_01050 [Bacteroidetes bacterium HGW-Bacteroidetes-22]HAQ65171.1 hypothetical protein [Bacteroidales bacterium]HBZ65824.1 hypothetical protein [Bacteroidales bacterium]